MSMSNEYFVNNVLRPEIKKAGSVKAFAKKAGVSPQFLYRVLRGSDPPSERLYNACYYKTERRIVRMLR